MIVSNLLFDIVLFGALLLGVIVDKIFPQLAGAASLVAVGVALYIASQEWSDALARFSGLLRARHDPFTYRSRSGQAAIVVTDSNKSLATAVAPSVLGFIYFWWRNQSDFSLLALSIVLMMSSLMIAISTIAALGGAWKEKSAAPLAGWLAAILGSILLGILGGLLALFLGGAATLFAKVLALGISLFGWKIRETLRPPQLNAQAHNATLPENSADADSDLSLPATHAARWFLIPQRGTLLDRFVPVLVLGALLFVAASQIKSPDLWTPTPPASADNGSVDNGSPDNGADTESTP